MEIQTDWGLISDFSFLTVAMVAECDYQSLCGREELFARYVSKCNLDLQDINDIDPCEKTEGLCTKLYWIPADHGSKTFWVKDKVQGDGNCFFRSLSKAMTGIEAFHPLLRTTIVDQMVEYRDLYTCLIDGDVSAHMNHMRKEDSGVFSWATEAEVKAAADLLGCDIYIQQQVGPKMCWCRFKSDEKFKHFEHYFITIIYEGNHFDLCRRANHFCNCALSREDMENWEDDIQMGKKTSGNQCRQVILWHGGDDVKLMSWSLAGNAKDLLSLYMSMNLSFRLLSFSFYDFHIVIFGKSLYLYDLPNSQKWTVRVSSNIIKNMVQRKHKLIGEDNGNQSGEATKYTKRNRKDQAIIKLLMHLWKKLYETKRKYVLKCVERNAYPTMQKVGRIIVHPADLRNIITSIRMNS